MSTPIGYFRPISWVDTTQTYRCKHCGLRWTETLKTMAQLSGTIEYDYCSECKGHPDKALPNPSYSSVIR